MTNFDSTRNIAYENKIVYDYGKTQIYKSEITSPNKGKSIPFSVPFYNSRKGEPNISYIDNTGISDTRYDSIKIYAYQLIHKNIQSLTIDQNSIIGELVVEHKNVNDPSDKQYLCFLLKHSSLNTDINDIDILLNFKNQEKSNTFIELNDIIPQQDNCIVYESKPDEIEYTNKVFIFTTPIEINATSKDIIVKCPINTSLFKHKSSKYQVLPSTNIAKRGDEDIYIDCSPTGESQETINTYNIPINSELSTNQEKADNMKTAIDFAYFAVYSLILSLILPSLYKATAIKAALLTTNATDGYTGTRLRSIDIIISLIMFISIITMMSVGFSSEDSSLSTISFIIFYSTVAGVLILYTKKANLDYLKIGSYEIKYNNNKSFDLEDISKSLAILFSEMWDIVNERKEGYGNIYFTSIIWFIIIAGILFAVGVASGYVYFHLLTVSVVMPIILSIIRLFNKKMPGESGATKPAAAGT